MNPQPLFIYIDESGNFDFTSSGTKFFILTAIITKFPNEHLQKFSELKHQILSGERFPGLKLEYLENELAHKFHATADLQIVRNEVFSLISQMNTFQAHSIVIQKNKTNPSLYKPNEFYSKILSSLITFIFKKWNFSKLVIFIDGNPVGSEKRAFVKALKKSINTKVNNQKYSLYCPSSSSNIFLQIADYVGWAIYRKWEKNDLRSYQVIKKYLDSEELDMFKRGKFLYYTFK